MQEMSKSSLFVLYNVYHMNMMDCYDNESIIEQVAESFTCGIFLIFCNLS